MRKPTKTLTIAIWPEDDGTLQQSEITKRGSFYHWWDGPYFAASSHIANIKATIEARGGHIEKRSNPRYDDEMRAYRYNQSIRMITGILR